MPYSPLSLGGSSDIVGGMTRTSVAVSGGRRDTSLIDGVEEVVVAHGDYERLTSEAIENVWVRLRAGQAAKPAARELGLCTGKVRAHLLRCGGIRPQPRLRAPGATEQG